MNLTKEQYYDRVYAAWIGKNIGGTLGGPYEGVRKKLLSVWMYTHGYSFRTIGIF